MHVFAAERLHGDDTKVPVLARGKTITARCWVYVRDDRPFGGAAAPAAMFYYSRDRGGEHPQAHLADYAGLFQADAYGGYGKLYEADRKPGPILEAACWVHARRPFFVLADVEAAARRKAEGKTPSVISPIAPEAVRRIDALFDIERDINGQSAACRRAVRQELSAPLVADLEAWMCEQRAKLSRGNDLARAMDYMLKRWTSFARFLDDGRICLSNNAAERALHGIALGRKSWLFAGSDRGGQRAAAMYSLIVTAKLNNIDPQAWLADVLARIAAHPAHQLDDLLPWNWTPTASAMGVAVVGLRSGRRRRHAPGRRPVTVTVTMPAIRLRPRFPPGAHCLILVRQPESASRRRSITEPSGNLCSNRDQSIFDHPIEFLKGGGGVRDIYGRYCVSGVVTDWNSNAPFAFDEHGWTDDIAFPSLLRECCLQCGEALRRVARIGSKVESFEQSIEFRLG
jgi:hypothetical protein